MSHRDEKTRSPEVTRTFNQRHSILYQPAPKNVYIRTVRRFPPPAGPGALHKGPHSVHGDLLTHRTHTWGGHFNVGCRNGMRMAYRQFRYVIRLKGWLWVNVEVEGGWTDILPQEVQNHTNHQSTTCMVDGNHCVECNVLLSDHCV